MTVPEARDWLGKYFLLFTIFLGGDIVLLSGKDTMLLRIHRDVGMNCFQIIIPTLIGQLTVIFRFFTGGTPDDKTELAIPSWIVKWPPTLLAGLVVATIILMALGNIGRGSTWSPSEDDFKTIVLFYVSVLNATTVLVVSKYFELPRKNQPKASNSKVLARKGED